VTCCGSMQGCPLRNADDVAGPAATAPGANT
jgi:hypothetical protein